MKDEDDYLKWIKEKKSNDNKKFKRFSKGEV